MSRPGVAGPLEDSPGARDDHSTEKAISAMATHSETVGEEKGGKHGDKVLQCIVVTPERTWLDELVDRSCCRPTTARSASSTATPR